MSYPAVQPGRIQPGGPFVQPGFPGAGAAPVVYLAIVLNPYSTVDVDSTQTTPMLNPYATMGLVGHETAPKLNPYGTTVN